MRISSLRRVGRGQPPGRRRGASATLAIVASGAMALVAAPVTASAVAAAVTATPASATTPTIVKPIAAPTATRVTLPTGDQVLVTGTGNKTSYTVLNRPGGSGHFVSYTAGNADHYVVPVEAQPYLNRELSPSLFDVSALLRAGTFANIPVSLAFAAGATPSAPPGVTLTSVSGASAQGYLTPSSGSAFAAGLRAAIGADVRAGRQPGTGPLFGGVASMSLAAAVTPGSAAPAVPPRYPLNILQINTLDLTGAPTDNATLLLVNTDSAARQYSFPVTGAGIARIAVPTGDYALLAVYFAFDSAGNLTETRNVVLDDFAVPASTTVKTLTVDERTATDPLTVSALPSQPAAQDYVNIEWVRVDAHGTASGIGIFGFGGYTPTYTDTQPVAKVGKLDWVVQWGALGTATAATPYRYDLAFGSAQIKADQTYAATPDKLATVTDAFYDDPVALGGSFLNGPVDPLMGDTFAGTTGGGENIPAGPLTQYLGTGDGGGWNSGLFDANFDSYSADPHTYVAGHSYYIEWAHGPLAPNVGPAGLGICYACAGSGVFNGFFNQVGDSDLSHVGFSPYGSTQFTLYYNGTLVGTTPGIGAEATNLPATPAVLREVQSTDRSQLSNFSQSTTTTTDVTFRYVPGLTKDNTLPASIHCDRNGLITGPCQFLPVLDLNYHLVTNALNTSPVGPEALLLAVNHLSYNGVGSHAPITSAAVSVSFDGGMTWQNANIVRSHGAYLALWSNPASAAGTSPELKVTATDNIGGSITQTVTNAYTIAAAARESGQQRSGQQ